MIDSGEYPQSAYPWDEQLQTACATAARRTRTPIKIIKEKLRTQILKIYLKIDFEQNRELIRKLVPEYEDKFIWDSKTKTPLITDVELERSYFNNLGYIDYGGRINGRFYFAYKYKGIPIEIYYKNDTYGSGEPRREGRYRMHEAVRRGEAEDTGYYDGNGSSGSLSYGENYARRLALNKEFGEFDDHVFYGS